MHLETSSSYDIDIIFHLLETGQLKEGRTIICNGFKQGRYIEKIAELIQLGKLNVIPVVDNKKELQELLDAIDEEFDVNIGIRIASEEEPKFEFYTSRLGIRYKRYSTVLSRLCQRE